MSQQMKRGARNLITDVPGIFAGSAQDDRLKSGVTVITADAPFTAGVHIMGGAPGTRETDLLAPDKTVAQVDALVLSGGSAFGLAAADGVADTLRKRGRGFRVGDQTIPIVPAAILYDLSHGDTAWDTNPYAELGRKALAAAAPELAPEMAPDLAPDLALGTVGAGTGATTANLKGGLGSASLILPSGHTVGAIVAVNALGSCTVDDGAHFHAAACEIDAEFGGLGPAASMSPALVPPTKLDNGATTIGVVATDAVLDKAAATRLAIAAHDGIARAIWPAHTPMDGDLIFAAATNARPGADPLLIGHAAAICMSRAIARAVYLAISAPGDSHPTWADRFGG